MCSNFYFFCNNYGFISDHKMSYYDVILQPKQCKCFPFDHVQTVFCNQVSNWSISCIHIDNGMHEDVKDNYVVLLIFVIVWAKITLEKSKFGKILRNDNNRGKNYRKILCLLLRHRNWEPIKYLDTNSFRANSLVIIFLLFDGRVAIFTERIRGIRRDWYAVVMSNQNGFVHHHKTKSEVSPPVGWNNFDEVKIQ